MKNRKWMLVCHLSGLAGYIIPFGNIIAPMLILAMKRDQYPDIVVHAREVINFQISFTIWMAVAALFIYMNLGFPVLIILIVGHIALIIYGAKKAEDGILYRYPFTVRFL